MKSFHEKHTFRCKTSKTFMRSKPKQKSTKSALDIEIENLKHQCKNCHFWYGGNREDHKCNLPWICPMENCGLKFITGEILRLHSETIHGIYSCQKCQEVFEKGKTEYKDHLKKCHLDQYEEFIKKHPEDEFHKNKTTRCRNCRFFLKRKDLKHHKCTNINISTTPENDHDYYQRCKTLLKKAKKPVDKERRDLLESALDMVFTDKCSICNNIFDNEKDLIAHLCIQHQFCKFCETQFTSRDDIIYNHLMELHGIYVQSPRIAKINNSNQLQVVSNITKKIIEKNLQNPVQTLSDTPKGSGRFCIYCRGELETSRSLNCQIVGCSFKDDLFDIMQTHMKKGHNLLTFCKACPEDLKTLIQASFATDLRSIPQKDTDLVDLNDLHNEMRILDQFEDKQSPDLILNGVKENDPPYSNPKQFKNPGGLCKFCSEPLRTSSKHFTCKFNKCDRKFAKLQNLQNHLYFVHSANMKCRNCPDSSKGAKNVLLKQDSKVPETVVLKHDSKALETIVLEQESKVPEMNVLEQNLCQCKLCLKLIKDMDKHLREDHQPRIILKPLIIKVLNCNFCSFVAPSQKSLDEHWFMNHSKLKSPEMILSEENLSQCKLCLKFVKNMDEHLTQKHQPIIRLEPLIIKLLNCDFCSFVAPTEKSLDHHWLKNHSKIKVK